MLHGLFAGIVAAGISMFFTNRYTSVAHILPADSRGSGGSFSQMGALAAAAGITLPGQENSDLSFVDILESRWMAKKLLMENYNFTMQSGYFGKSRAYHEDLYTYLHAKNIDRACVKLKRIMSVSRDFKSKLLTISVETHSPDLSQQIVEKATRVLENFIEVKARTRGATRRCSRPSGSRKLK